VQDRRHDDIGGKMLSVVPSQLSTTDAALTAKEQVLGRMFHHREVSKCHLSFVLKKVVGPAG
jgi:hypothetical protein